MPRIVDEEDIKQLGTIMSIWAHPDDESFLAAGLLAAAIQNGQRVICVTATRGEAGSHDTKKWPPSELAAVRTKELEEALDILGVAEHYWLNYQDGHCHQVPLNEGASKLLTIIEETRPDSILTFGSDGWTGHEDHKTMNSWAKVAVKKTGRDITIYCVVHTPEHYQRYFKPADEVINIFFNIDMPPLLPADKCDIYFELSDKICQKKCDALAASPSQTEALFKLFDRDFVREAFAVECFVKAK